MIYTNFARPLFLACLPLVLALASCQKGVDIDLDNPPPIPGNIQDSTLLIKSIARTYNNGQDSIVEHYSYDTINKKIILEWTDTYSDPVYPGDQSEYHNTKAELSYNSKGLLTGVVYTYPSSYVPFDYDYGKIDIRYDNDNIVQEIVVKYMTGISLSSIMNKTMLPGGGYRLEWSISDPNISDDMYYRTAVFSNDGKNIVNVEDHRLNEISPSGDPVEYKFIRTDSLVYDVNGNVLEVLTNFVDGRDSTTANYTSYEFTGRQTKGNELYNQRRLIMNGLADMPFGESDDISYGVGILSFHFEYEYFQYSKYPADAAKVRMWDGAFKDFATHPTYDNKNRLTKFTGFFVDNDLEPHEYRITYYK